MYHTLCAIIQALAGYMSVRWVLHLRCCSLTVLSSLTDRSGHVSSGGKACSRAMRSRSRQDVSTSLSSFCWMARSSCRSVSLKRSSVTDLRQTKDAKGQCHQPGRAVSKCHDSGSCDREYKLSHLLKATSRLLIRPSSEQHASGCSAAAPSQCPSSSCRGLDVLQSRTCPFSCRASKRHPAVRAQPLSPGVLSR